MLDMRLLPNQPQWQLQDVMDNYGAGNQRQDHHSRSIHLIKIVRFRIQVLHVL